MLLESGIDIKNIPVYDSIEEVAEWPGGDWNNAVQGEGVGDKLIKVNPSKIKGDSNMKASLDKKNSIKSKGTLKNYENLVYDEEKGLLCDPLTNKYYDIKAK